VQGSAGIEAAGERDADFLSFGDALENRRHGMWLSIANHKDHKAHEAKRLRVLFRIFVARS
jgi:hypothetical protein